MKERDEARRCVKSFLFRMENDSTSRRTRAMPRFIEIVNEMFAKMCSSADLELCKANLKCLLAVKFMS